MTGDAAGFADVFGAELPPWFNDELVATAPARTRLRDWATRTPRPWPTTFDYGATFEQLRRHFFGDVQLLWMLLDALARVRRTRLGGPPHVVVERADREAELDAGAAGCLGEHVEVAQHERALGEDGEGIAGRSHSG